MQRPVATVRAVSEPDDIAEAVLTRDEVVRYLQGGGGRTPDEAQAAIQGYLEELRTTQRYRMYRALQHPVYPILRKIERIGERIDVVRTATRQGRVIYASNHKSHLDYLVQPIVLDDNGIRPPVIAAGINLFGGALGLIHKYVTGAIPIRRETKDPAYLVTLKAYVAESLRRTDLFLYLEGGRSYSGALKPFKTGLLHAVAAAKRSDTVIVPTAIAYDLILEDFILSRQQVKRIQRPFSQEVAEMIRYAVGYRSRSIVTFGDPITFDGCDPDDRRDMVRLQRRDPRGSRPLLQGVAVSPARSRPPAADGAGRAGGPIDRLIEILQSTGANLDVTTGREAVDMATEPLATRGIIVVEGNRYRARQRLVLRYYARTIEHLLKPHGASVLTH